MLFLLFFYDVQISRIDVSQLRPFNEHIFFWSFDSYLFFLLKFHKYRLFL